MAKRNKPKREFYSISTYVCSINKSTLINTIYFENKDDAINNITTLFNKVYPRGYDSRGEMIESPKYHDGECYLIRFYTPAAYCYQLTTEYFEV